MPCPLSKERDHKRREMPQRQSQCVRVSLRTLGFWEVPWLKEEGGAMSYFPDLLCGIIRTLVWEEGCGIERGLRGFVVQSSISNRKVFMGVGILLW